MPVLRLSRRSFRCSFPSAVAGKEAEDEGSLEKAMRSRGDLVSRLPGEEGALCPQAFSFLVCRRAEPASPAAVAWLSVAGEFCSLV